jgi:hypothetical protein
VDQKQKQKLVMVVQARNPSIWEAEAGGSWIRSQPGLHVETVPQNKTKNIPQNNKTEKEKKKTQQ